MSRRGGSRGERGGVLVKILVALALIAFVVIAAVAVAGYFAVRKASQVAEQVAKDPAGKAIEWISRLNPDLEIERQPDGRFRVRNRKSGEEATVDLTRLREGKFELKRPDGRDVRIEAGAGGVMLERDGTVTQLGAAGPAPDWLPTYPGTTGYESGFSARGFPGVGGGVEGSAVYSLTVAESPEEVVAWYAAEFRAAGFEVGEPQGQAVTINQSGPLGGTASGTLLVARNHDGSRVARVLALGGKSEAAGGAQVFVAVVP
ncbi:MAG: hypothetical protein MUC67_08965 [Acidobacteria bacterium]|nr:hypothetical protein [Acidobacteriota bacterium]